MSASTTTTDARVSFRRPSGGRTTKNAIATVYVFLATALAVIPLWAFCKSTLLLAVGAFFMQAGVQGAWCIIPAHLNELSPDAVRGLPRRS